MSCGGTFARMRLALLALLGACVGPSGAFDRPWTFRFTQATIAAQQADGSPWDVDDSPPDPYVALSLDGSQIGMTPTLDDTLTPNWNFGIETRDIQVGDSISINLNDDDTFVDDVIIGGCDFTLTEAFAAQGGGNCTDSLGTLDFTITLD